VTPSRLNQAAAAAPVRPDAPNRMNAW
jgi:hypothetical protein